MDRISRIELTKPYWYKCMIVSLETVTSRTILEALKRLTTEEEEPNSLFLSPTDYQSVSKEVLHDSSCVTHENWRFTCFCNQVTGNLLQVTEWEPLPPGRVAFGFDGSNRQKLKVN